MESKGATLEELAPLISGQKGLEVFQTGELDRGLVSVGQVVGLIHSIPTVKEVVDSIIAGAKAIGLRFNSMGVFAQ
jgi:hypothetical protein